MSDDIPEPGDPFEARLAAGLRARAHGVAVADREHELLARGGLSPSRPQTRIARPLALVAVLALVASLGGAWWFSQRSDGGSAVDLVSADAADRDGGAAISATDATEVDSPSIDDWDLIVWMDPSATPEQLENVAEALDRPEILDSVFFDQASTYEEFTELFAETPEMVEVVTPDVLPPSYRLMLDARDGASLDGIRAALSAEFLELPGVRDVIRGMPASEATAPPVELTVLAVSSNPLEFVLLDLRTGQLQFTRLEEHQMGDGYASGAAISPRGDALVWRDGVYVFPDADMTAPPTRLLPADLRLVPSIAPELLVVPTEEAGAVWISQHAVYWNDDANPAILDLVDVDSGEVRTTIEIAETITPVGAAGDRLVLNAFRTLQIDGNWVPDYGNPHVVVVEPDGSVRELRDGGAIATSGDLVAGQVDGELVVDDLETGGQFEVERPDGFRWSNNGGPMIPGTSQPLPQVSSNGELLMYLIDENAATDVNGFTAQGDLVAVSLVDGTIRPIATLDRLPVVTWSQDGNSVVAFWGREIGVVAGADGDELISVGMVPDGFYVLGVG